MTTFSADSRSFATAQELAKLTPEQQALAIQSLTPAEREQLLHCWRFWARPKQLAPDWLWRYWVVCAGRGFGKTRCGAEWVLERVEKGAKSIAIAGRTARAVRREMVEGESGILRCAPPWNRPEYQPSLCRIIWPNGAVANTYSADEPDSMRGPKATDLFLEDLYMVMRAEQGLEVWPTFATIKRGYAHGGSPITNAPTAMSLDEALELVGDVSGRPATSFQFDVEAEDEEEREMDEAAE